MGNTRYAEQGASFTVAITSKANNYRHRGWSFLERCNNTSGGNIQWLTDDSTGKEEPMHRWDGENKLRCPFYLVSRWITTAIAEVRLSHADCIEHIHQRDTKTRSDRDNANFPLRIEIDVMD